MKYGLSDATIAKICGVFTQFSDIEKVILYGSRAKGNYKAGSDIDLTLVGAKLSQMNCMTIAEALDELLLPYSIDLSVFALLNHPDLEAHIERVGLIFYEH